MPLINSLSVKKTINAVPECCAMERDLVLKIVIMQPMNTNSSSALSVISAVQAVGAHRAPERYGLGGRLVAKLRS